MADYKELYQSADWATEKHVPVISAPDKVKKGEFFKVAVVVGQEVPHPNTTAHHIGWVTVTFKAEGDKFPYEVGRAEFAAHGASAEGADTSSVYTHPGAVISFKTEKSGTIYASSYCNIHGFWQNSQDVKVEG